MSTTGIVGAKFKRRIVNMENILKITGRDLSLCSGCNECINLCPEDCFSGFTVRLQNSDLDDFSGCTGCGECIDNCPSGAIDYDCD